VRTGLDLLGDQRECSEGAPILSVA